MKPSPMHSAHRKRLTLKSAFIYALSLYSTINANSYLMLFPGSIQRSRYGEHSAPVIGRYR